MISAIIVSHRTPTPVGLQPVQHQLNFDYGIAPSVCTYIRDKLPSQRACESGAANTSNHSQAHYTIAICGIRPIRSRQSLYAV